MGKLLGGSLFAAHLLLLFSTSPLLAKGVEISGVVYSDLEKEPIPFAVVAVIEAKKKVRSDEAGRYVIELEPGEYTFAVTAPGVGSLSQKVSVTKTDTLDLYIEALRLRSSGAVIEEERDIQSVSRYTVTNEDIKTIPATFGDSLGAVAAFAGIERSGVFGPLSIRGMDNLFNRYYIDGVPVRKPQHFGGLHSVVHNDLIASIDIYSSAFPVYFGDPLAAVIEINTVDKVEERSTYIDLGLLSANAATAGPLTKGDEYAGYWHASGRYGYLTLIVPKLIAKVTGDMVKFDIFYYDYQAKTKYYLNKNNSITLLLVGAVDFISVATDFDHKSRAEAIQDGADPLSLDVEAELDSYYHMQTLAHTWRPSDLIYNKLRAYSSLNKSVTSQNFRSADVAAWAKDLHIDSMPNIYGLKDDFLLKLLDNKINLKLGLDYSYYDFKAEGKTLIPTGVVKNTMPDFRDPDQFTIAYVSQSASTSTLGAYTENKLELGGLEAVAGYRWQYLQEFDRLAADPRGRFSYTLPTQTVISAAGGLYTSFFQTNTLLFDSAPEIMESDLEAEKAIHRAVGLEQKFRDLNSIKIEGYYNYYYDLVELGMIEKDGEIVAGDNLGEIETYGVEVTLKRDRSRAARDLYGWVSYTYGNARHKSHLPDAIGSTGQTIEYYGDLWMPSNTDRRHSLKIIAGYRFGEHSFDAKFQFYTSFPYTPIVDDDNDPLGTGRYAPVLGTPNSARFPAEHQLDIRYSRRAKESWGSWTFYAELINAYNKKSDSVQNWKFNERYQPGSNPVYESDSPINLMTNLGIEVRF